MQILYQRNLPRPLMGEKWGGTLYSEPDFNLYTSPFPMVHQGVIIGEILSSLYYEWFWLV
jgi:hypothetical protein